MSRDGPCSRQSAPNHGEKIQACFGRVMELTASGNGPFFLSRDSTLAALAFCLVSETFAFSRDCYIGSRLEGSVPDITMLAGEGVADICA